MLHDCRNTPSNSTQYIFPQWGPQKVLNKVVKCLYPWSRTFVYQNMIHDYKGDINLGKIL